MIALDPVPMTRCLVYFTPTPLGGRASSPLAFLWMLTYLCGIIPDDIL